MKVRTADFNDIVKLDPSVWKTESIYEQEVMMDLHGLRREDRSLDDLINKQSIGTTVLIPFKTHYLPFIIYRFNPAYSFLTRFVRRYYGGSNSFVTFPEDSKKMYKKSITLHSIVSVGKMSYLTVNFQQTGWKDSAIRSFLNGEFADSIDPVFSKRIKKPRLNTEYGWDNQTTYDKVWIPTRDYLKLNEQNLPLRKLKISNETMNYWLRENTKDKCRYMFHNITSDVIDGEDYCDVIPFITIR